MKKSLSVLLALLGSVSAMAQALSFASPPTLTRDNGTGRYWVEFTLNRAADVAVSIVNRRDSTVIRRLAAGLLGPKAPPPLTTDSLHQRLEWDGTDDAGLPAATPESLTVRVRAGMGAKLANIVGESFYVFNSSFGGIVPSADGSLYIYGSAGAGSARSFYLRQYDAAGNYLRTAYPPAAGLPQDSVTAYGVNVLPGGGWTPKVTAVSCPFITNSYLTKTGTQILPIGRPGEIVMVNGTNMQSVNENGAFANTAARKIINSPAAPTGPYIPMGPHYFAASASPDTLYLSGWYYGTRDMGTWLIDAVDTGFWADGQVFKVSRSTGIVTPWLKMDSIPVNKTLRLSKLGGGANATATLHGVAVDDSGHVFVCDRLHRQIGVYDTNATLLGALPVVNPDYVAVSRRTGAIYVITRSDNAMALHKFAGWRSPAAAVATVSLTSSINTYTGAPTLVATENGSTTILWAGYERFGVRQFRDDGAAFTLLRDFSVGGGNLVYDRLEADPATDWVYLTNGWTDLFKIEDWNTPVPVRCSLATKKPLYAGDMAVGPGGLLYVRRGNSGSHGSDFNGPMARYTQGRYHAPANYSNTDSNITTNSLYGRYGIAYGDKGIGVSRLGRVGAIHMSGWNDYNFHMYPDTGYADTAFKGVPTVTTLGGKCGGLKFDRDGNMYLGLWVKGPDRLVPPGFTTDWAYNLTGSVVKYAVGTTGTPAVNSVKVYPQMYGPFSADGGSSCVCRSPRFDLDGYGRLFIPDALTNSVTVSDNAGNSLLTFGEYGNTDSRGGLPGPGRTSAEPAIPLAYPIAAAATEDFVYVNDWVNARLVRVQLTYELDNIPGLTLHNTTADSRAGWASLALSASPNPCAPVSTIRVALPRAGRVSLQVFDAAGRLVRTVTDGLHQPGPRRFTWHGRDSFNRPVAPGLYVFRLSAGGRVLTARTVLAR